MNKAANPLIEEIVLQSVLSTPNGRAWMWTLLGKCNIWDSFGTLDHAAMAYCEGRRSIGIQLQQTITRLFPEAYVRMVQENSGGKIKDNNNGDRSDTSGDDSGSSFDA